MARLILASASPRRREILSALGVEHEAVATEAEELTEGAAPEVLVLENARRKAVAGLERARAEPGEWSLGVDTEVVLGGRLLGKAVSVEEARERLLALSGRTHEVLSGVVLVQSRRLKGSAGTEGSTLHTLHSSAGAPERPERSGVASSLVAFRELDEPILHRYLASGEWRDRAGAYAIQGLGSTLVERLEGDLSNVVGLPVRLLLDLAPELFPHISSESAG
jgi:septum formation protein